MSPKPPCGIPTQTNKKGKGSAMGELVPFQRFRADLTHYDDDETEVAVFDVFNHGREHPRHPANLKKMEQTHERQQS